MKLDEVLSFLNEKGYKTKRSTLYLHKKQGKIQCEKDGTYTEEKALKYAETWLKKTDGSDNADLYDIQKKRLNSEAKKSEAQARYWQVRADRETKEWIKISDYIADITTKAALIKADFQTFAYAKALKIVTIVEGNPENTNTLIEFLLSEFENFFDKYSKATEFEI